ncbi:hypothetical protein [Clostridium minihomine]|uniref:hypothetical protein n=1 Tax=Clostridium minihomine TaxID=2045012 RepID=UPI000C75F367|nr:hypothetical protein [Clostridium minihomine]
MNGNYRISLRTPLGVQNGIITFVNKEGALSGSIRAMGNVSFFRNGKIDGNRFEFSGILNAGLLNLKYTAQGVVDGEKLQVTAVTSYGTFLIVGTKTV